jgi:hypothetical protein
MEVAIDRPQLAGGPTGNVAGNQGANKSPTQGDNGSSQDDPTGQPQLQASVDVQAPRPEPAQVSRCKSLEDPLPRNMHSTALAVQGMCLLYTPPLKMMYLLCSVGAAHADASFADVGRRCTLR